MDVVFSSATSKTEIRETWAQKEHPEVCCPEQWLQEDLGSNVRIFETRYLWNDHWPAEVSDHSFEEAAMQRLDYVAKIW